MTIDQKKREIPVFEIEGTAFLVDVDKALLIEVNHAENVILFGDMTYKGTHYLLRYDKRIKNWPGRYGYNPDPGKELRIPQLKELDPGGMCRKYGIPGASLNGKTDFEIRVDQGLLAERLAGKLPIVDIGGRDFIFDYEAMQLRLRGDINTAINLEDIEDWSIERELYYTYYNVKSMQLIYIDPATISELPEDIVLLEIPYAYRLDPVAHARKEGMELEDMVIKYPIEAKSTVDVIPIEKTNLPKLVEANRERALMGDEWPLKLMEDDRPQQLRRKR